MEFVTTAPLTREDIRRDVASVVSRYGMTVDEFAAADLDDLEVAELRDLWLMFADAIGD